MDAEFILLKDFGHSTYEKYPLYFQRQNGEYLLYKPAGVPVKEIRFRDGLLPANLYIKKKNKIEAVQEIQKEYIVRLKRSIREKKPENVRKIVHDIMRVTLEEPVRGSIEGIKKTVNILVDEYTQDFKIIRTLLDLTGTDYTAVLHSVNVMALSLGYANYVNFDMAKIRDFGLAALLHDIGKVRIRPELLHAPRPLTEREFREVQLHTTEGFNIIEKCRFSNAEIKLTALQHHEKLDGSGYPFQTCNISEFAQIISIIDCYEALTNDERLYRKSLMPLNALEIIQSEIVDTGKFSKDFFKNFAHLLVLFYN